MNHEPELILDSHHGVYIPQLFAQQCEWQKLEGIDPDDITTLCHGPTHEWYWEAWTQVLDSATYVDPDGTTWYLYQNMDLWLIPETFDTEAEGWI